MLFSRIVSMKSNIPYSVTSDVCVVIAYVDQTVHLRSHTISVISKKALSSVS